MPIPLDYIYPSTAQLEKLTTREQDYLAGFLLAAEIYAKDYSMYNTPLQVGLRYIQLRRETSGQRKD